MGEAYLSKVRLLGTAVAIAACTATVGPTATSATDVDPSLRPPADVIELRDGNSVLRSDVLKFNTNEAWFVDGIDTLFTDLYFFNVGINPAQRELRLEDFDSIALHQPAENQLLFNGQSSIFGAHLNFSLSTTLHGGAAGSFQSWREDVIQVSYTGSAPLPFTLYSYIDYDLSLDSRFDNDTLTFSGNRLIQTDGSGLRASLESVGRRPSAVELNRYPYIITRLYDDTRTNLGPTAMSPLFPSLGVSPKGSDPAGSQTLKGVDGTAALQFNDTLQPDQPLTFRFVKTIARDNNVARIPEPTVLVGLGAVVGALAWLRRS